VYSRSNRTMRPDWTGIESSRRTCAPTRGIQDFAIEKA
jgi:hypothetical protein